MVCFLNLRWVLPALSGCQVMLSLACFVLPQWFLSPALYDEIRQFRKACGEAHLKTILATGELGSLTNVYKASMIAMMAGKCFMLKWWVCIELMCSGEISESSWLFAKSANHLKGFFFFVGGVWYFMNPRMVGSGHKLGFIPRFLMGFHHCTILLRQ